MNSPAATPQNSPVPGVYQHYKGKTYQVLGMARHSETEEWLVVYQALYGARGFWLRPLKLWLEPVVRDDNTESGSCSVTQRFRLLQGNERTLQSVVNTALPK
ncbi:MAG: DUF1653 domain-containing protein [Granulosicoccus sp.]|nr:DUF1653 domain-containing protein [Granulosicoccus sp.]